MAIGFPVKDDYVTGDVLTAANMNDLSGTLNTLSGAGATINPNLVINGNYTINQRGYVSAANLASGSYGFDRWKSNFTNTTLTYTSAPAGQSVTINSGGGLQQIVEQANVPAGTYVLSWTGTATGRIYNVGATPAAYAASPVSFTADGLANVTVEFTATGATKTCSKVKLELGTTISTFVYAGGTIQGELAACQRYFYAVTADGNNNGAAPVTSHGTGVSSTIVESTLPIPVTMRSAPSFSVSSITSFRVFDNVNSAIVTTNIVLSTVGSQVNAVSVKATVASGVTQFRPYYIIPGSALLSFIYLSAEL